jgi:AcrR family transcriptional regulator
MSKQSLRFIKKEATAQALADAAFELALEKGLDGFLIDDVVQRANYSKRTFANHYSCKEEAVAMAALSIKGIEEAEALRPVGEGSPLETLQEWVKLRHTAEVLWKMRELVKLSKRYPTLEPYILSAFHRLQITAQESLENIYHDRYTLGYTRLLTGAVFGAVLPIVDGSLNVTLPRDPTPPPGAAAFEEYWETTVGYLRNGF